MNKEKKDLIPEDVMKKALNSINNDQLIKIGDSWTFFFAESDNFVSSPVNSYYFMSHDLSINIYFRFKWALYGWFFLKSLSGALDNKTYSDKMSFPNAINPNSGTIKHDKILLFDKVEVGSIDLFKNELESEFWKNFLFQNDLTSFKLKLNANEYIAIQNTLFPRIGEQR